MPVDNSEAGLAAAAEIQGKYVATVTVAAGVIDVEYGNDAHATIAGMALQLTPDTTAAGSVQWICASAAAEIENKHLPAACRT